MTIRNEIFQAKSLGPRITAVEPLDNYQLFNLQKQSEIKIVNY